MLCIREHTMKIVIVSVCLLDYGSTHECRSYTDHLWYHKSPCLLKFINIYIYLMGREREFPSFGLLPKMPSTAGAELGEGQELSVQPWFPCVHQEPI